jgi:hypothetical protein
MDAETSDRERSSLRSAASPIGRSGFARTIGGWVAVRRKMSRIRVVSDELARASRSYR